MNNKFILFLVLSGITSTSFVQDAQALVRKKRKKGLTLDAASKEELVKIMTVENLKKAFGNMKGSTLKISGAEISRLMNLSSAAALDEVEVFLKQAKTEEEKKDLAKKSFHAYKKILEVYGKNPFAMANAMDSDTASTLNKEAFELLKASKNEGWASAKFQRNLESFIDAWVEKSQNAGKDETKKRIFEVLLNPYKNVKTIEDLANLVEEHEVLIDSTKKAVKAATSELKGLPFSAAGISKYFEKFAKMADISKEELNAMAQKIKFLNDIDIPVDVQSASALGSKFVKLLKEGVKEEVSESVIRIINNAAAEGLNAHDIYKRLESNSVVKHFSKEQFASMGTALKAQAEKAVKVADILEKVIKSEVTGDEREETASNLKRYADEMAYSNWTAEQLFDAIENDKLDPRGKSKNVMQRLSKDGWNEFKKSFPLMIDSGKTTSAETTGSNSEAEDASGNTTLTETQVQNLINQALKVKIAEDNPAYEAFNKLVEGELKNKNSSLKNLITIIESNADFLAIFNKNKLKNFKKGNNL